MKLHIIFLLSFSILLSGCNLPPKTIDNSLTPTTDENEEERMPMKDVPSKDTLDLNGQGLTSVSQDVFTQSNLKELNVSHNSLTGALPAEIRHLQKLEILNASNNSMTGLPAEIGQLQNLRILNVSNNQLTGLPYELGNLKNLQTLNISGNAYSEHDLSIIQQALPSTVTIIK